MKSAYHVILAEDHVRFRKELKKIINKIPDIEVVAEVGEGNEFFELLENFKPELVILDISMPNLRAMKATQEIKSKYPDIKVIIMIMDDENEYLAQAIASGADGIVLKQDCAMDLELAINKIHQGEKYFPKALEEKIPGVNPMKLNRLDGTTFLPIC